MPAIITEYPYFFTASVWKHQFLFAKSKYKEIILDSLRYLVSNNCIRVFAFVIMSNHIHLIWQIMGGYKLCDIQRDFLKFTARQLQIDLTKNNPKLLENFRVDKTDRKYQFWQRNALSIELRSKHVFDQKLNYIHRNPVKAGLCSFAEEYYFSSGRFYKTGIDSFGFLTHTADW